MTSYPMKSSDTSAEQGRLQSYDVEGRIVEVSGKWLRVASIQDEDWHDGDVAPVPEQFIDSVKHAQALNADVFTFCQKPDDPTPRFRFPFELESIAAISTLSFSDWWNNRVSTDLRHDVRRAAKRGVVVRTVEFTDEFVRGIMTIYDETPIRQGRPFWHYREDFDSVKAGNSTYLQRSEFLGAYCGDELIGFLKIVYVDRMGRLMQIIAKDMHRDKRPMNALIAKAVEVCEAKGCSLLTYGKYRYSQGEDSVTAFKRRNGFEEILVPRYYVPLTAKGKLAMFLQLHRGAKAMLPRPMLRSLRKIRSSVYSRLQPSMRS